MKRLMRIIFIARKIVPFSFVNEKVNMPRAKLRINSMDLKTGTDSPAEAAVSSSEKPTPLEEIDTSASEGTHQQPSDKNSDEVCNITSELKKEALSEEAGNDFGTPLIVSFMNEKKNQNGEDSDPLVFLGKNISAVGVFDGMGGAGSALHMYNGSEKTGAYIGSRSARDAAESFFKKMNKKPKADIVNYDIVNDLKETIKRTFNSLKKNYPPKVKSGLKSSMIKEFPTTLAIVAVSGKEKTFSVDSYWAGDSRNYILTQDGLFQLSVDDLENRADPYENLTSDSPLSNQISADKDFVINHVSYKPKDAKFMIFCATDGCFGYYPTPMHFEYAFLKTLSESNSVEEWNGALLKEFGSIAADDISMAGLIYGYDNLDSFKDTIQPRYNELKKVIEAYDNKINKIEEAKSKVSIAESELISFKQEAWNDYKQSYMSIINKDESND